MLTAYAQQLIETKPHYHELLRRKEAGEKLQMRYFDLFWMFKIEGTATSWLAELYDLSEEKVRAQRYKWDIKLGKQMIHPELLSAEELAKLIEFSQRYEESKQEI